MNSAEDLKALRERRERLLKREAPRVRPLEQKDAWVLWAAYDLGSFPAMPKGMKAQEFFACIGAWVKRHSSVLVIEANHRYFREKRGPVALVTIDNFGWQIEPQIDFFFWTTKRQRLAAAVSFLHMVRYARDVGVCVVRASERDVAFCEHLYEYDLLRLCGKLPNASESGTQHIFYLKGRRQKEQDEVKLKEAA